MVREHAGRDLAARGKDAEGNGQVETARILRQVGWREVRRNATRGEFESRMVEGRTHAILRLAHLRIGKPDNGESGQSRTQVNLNGDFGRADPHQRPASYYGKRHMPS